MDYNSIDLYKKALSEGETSVHSIRVMVVGHYGVGKTTLTKRLLGEDVDLDARDSTDGIDVHVRRCRVSLEDQKWTVLKKDEKVDNVSRRLAQVLAKQSISDTTDKMTVETARTSADAEGLHEVTVPKRVDYADAESLRQGTTPKTVDDADAESLREGTTPKTVDDADAESLPEGTTSKTVDDADAESLHEVTMPKAVDDDIANTGGPGLYEVVKFGHNIHCRPNLKSTAIGRLTMGNQVVVTEELVNVDGTWVKLDAESTDAEAWEAWEAWALALSKDSTSYLQPTMLTSRRSVGNTGAAFLFSNYQAEVVPTNDTISKTPVEADVTDKSVEGYTDKKAILKHLKDLEKTLQTSQHMSKKEKKKEKKWYSRLRGRRNKAGLSSNSSKSKDNDYADVSFWDFAGQSVFYNTHQSFLSRRAIYLLVTDIRKHVNDIVGGDMCYFNSKGAELLKIHEHFNLWLNSIHALCPPGKKGVPPAILVATHADKLDQKTVQTSQHMSKKKAKKWYSGLLGRRTAEEQTSQPDTSITSEIEATVAQSEQETKYFKAVRDTFNERITAAHVVYTDFAINNAIVDPNLARLQQEIYKVAAQQDYWGEKIPAKWLTLERALDELRDTMHQIITRDKLRDVNKSMPVPIAKEEYLDLFLRFHHDTANILYFNDPDLRDYIVLDPQWLINSLKSLITADLFRSGDPLIVTQWKELRSDGILTHKLIDAVWNQEGMQTFLDHKDHLLRLMMKLNLIAQIDEQTHGGCYLVPGMLTKAPANPPKKDYYNSTSDLCISTSDDFLPVGVFQRLLAGCVSNPKWKISRQDDSYLIYCGYGCFEIDTVHRMMLYFSACTIQMWVSYLGAKLPGPNPELCAEVREYVLQTLQKINTCLSLSQDLELSIKCPDIQELNELPVDGMFKIDDLLKRHSDGVEQICHAHAEESHPVSCSELLRHWYGERIKPDSDDATTSLAGISGMEEAHRSILCRHRTNPDVGLPGERGLAIQQQPAVDLPQDWPNVEAMTAQVIVEPCGVHSQLVEDYWNSPAVYSMKKHCRGRCVIIANQVFHGVLKEVDGKLQVLPTRHGTYKDEDKLVELFKQLHFDVVLHYDKTAEQMKQVLRDEALEDAHKDAECFVCIICSHGNTTGIYGTDSQVTPLETIISQFDGKNCPALRSKPKLIFIQACQGEEEDKLEQTIDSLLPHVENRNVGDACQEAGNVPTKADMLVAHATHPGYISLRNTVLGSWFIQAVIYVFKRYAHKEDILSLLTLVNRLVARGRTDGNIVQAPVIRTSLLKKLYFFPGVPAPDS